MSTPRKISELNELSYADLEAFPTGVYVPAIVSVSGESTNKKFSFSEFVLKVLNRFSNSTTSTENTGNNNNSENPGNENPGTSVDTSALEASINSLLNLLNSLSSTVNNFSSASNYPTHVIVVLDSNNNSISYNLPTGPGSQSLRVLVKTTALESPAFILNVSTVSISKNDSSLIVSVYAEANATSSNCTGGTVSSLVVSGSFTSPNTTGNFTAETILSNVHVDAGSIRSNTVQLPVVLTQPIDLAVIQLNLNYGGLALGIKVTASIVGNNINNGSASTYIF